MIINIILCHSHLNKITKLVQIISEKKNAMNSSSIHLMFLLSCKSYKYHKIRIRVSNKLKRQRNKHNNDLVCIHLIVILLEILKGIYLAKCFQIQSDHAGSTKVERSLCILYHQNEVLLHLNGKFMPIDIVETGSHVCNTLRSHRPNVAVQ